MSGSQNWLIPTTAEEFFSHQNRRIGQEERRPSVRKASDILGPGIAPFATPVDDMDGDTAAFNGFWILEPGAGNTPDITKWWVGQTIADQFNGGTQMLSTFRPDDAVGGQHLLMMRSFSIAPDSPARFYSAWQRVGGGDSTVGKMRSLIRTSTLNVPNAAFTPVTWQTERADSQTGSAIGTPGGVAIATIAGVYHVHASVDFATNATGRRLAQIRNATTGLVLAYDEGVVAGVYSSMSISGAGFFSVNDVIELSVFQSTGAAMTLPVTTRTSIAITRIS